MGYHHCNIPPIQICKKEFANLKLEKFVLKYIKCQTFIGDSDAIRFIEDKISEWKEIKLDSKSDK